MGKEARYRVFAIRISIRVGLFLANTLIPFQRLHSLAFSIGTFAYAKDQASLLLDGLLKDYPTPCFPELFEVNDQSVLARGRHSGLISTLRLLSFFVYIQIQIVNEDEYKLLPESLCVRVFQKIRHFKP